MLFYAKVKNILRYAKCFKIKLRNITRTTINESVKLKYQYIDNDEIIDSGFTYIHVDSDPQWESHLIKSTDEQCLIGFSDYDFI